MTSGLQGGVEAGWERTGSTGGIGPDCEQVPAIRSNQGVCTYVPALCFSQEPGEQGERDPEARSETETEIGPGTTHDGSQTLCYISDPVLHLF